MVMERRAFEVGSGKRNSEKAIGAFECGSGTRRHPKGGASVFAGLRRDKMARQDAASGP